MDSRGQGSRTDRRPSARPWAPSHDFKPSATLEEGIVIGPIYRRANGATEGQVTFQHHGLQVETTAP